MNRFRDNRGRDPAVVQVQRRVIRRAGEHLRATQQREAERQLFGARSKLVGMPQPAGSDDEGSAA